jgi:type VI secretion system Hcp family effector
MQKRSLLAAVAVAVAGVIALVATAGVIVGAELRRPPSALAAPLIPPPRPAGESCPPALDFAAVGSGYVIYAKIAGITGPVTARGHVGDVQITKLRSDLVGAGNTACGATATKPAIGRITLTKPVDEASVRLISAAALHGALSNVQIAVVRSNGSEPMHYELTGTVIDGISTQWQGGAPVEQIQLSFDGIAWEYRPESPNGGPGPAVKFCWRVDRQQKCG